MFNVAVTRAKFKLYVVVNFAFCQKRAKNNALADLLYKLVDEKRLMKVDAKVLLPNIAVSRPLEFSGNGMVASKHFVCREDSFYEHFTADVQSFKEWLVIYSPFMTESRLGMLLPAFHDAVHAGKQIVVVTKALSDRKCYHSTKNVKKDCALWVYK